MKKRVVLIGSNELTKFHFSEIRRSEYLELVGVFNLNFKHKFEIFDDISQLFFKTNCDGVIISCENSQKEKYILECIKFVKNIFVELPLLNITKINSQVVKNNSKLFISNYDRENPIFSSIINEISKDKKIFLINYLRGNSQNCDILNENFIQDMDTINEILKSSIKNFHCQKIEENGKISQLSFSFISQNEILTSLQFSNSYPKNRQIIEVCSDSGVYIGNFLDLSLYKISKDKKINLRVDKEISPFKNLYKQFFDFCSQNKENLRVKNLENLENLI